MSALKALTILALSLAAPSWALAQSQAPEASTPPTAEHPEGGSLHGFLTPEVPKRMAALDVSDATARVNQDALYARPFVASISGARSKTAIGGYLEANANYFVEDGVSEGFGFEFRRFNVFIYSAIADKIKFMSELEFEHGVEEIALETAQIDFVVDQRLSFKAGIILPPLGRFNANHDSPRYDFVDRPLVSTEIIPSTLSEVGAGGYGRRQLGAATLTYDVYAVNGLGEGVILDDAARTALPAGKSDEFFAGDNNGRPSCSSRIALAHEAIGEWGLSYYGGVYNRYRLEGALIEPKRRLHVVALDVDADFGDLTVQGEAALAQIQVPTDLDNLFGEQQYGFYLDLVYPLWRFDWSADAESTLSAAARLERVDFNTGKFNEGAAAGDRIYDEQTALSLGPSLRPVPDTAILLNYRNIWTRDFLGNPVVRQSGIQLGIASYF